MGIGCYIERSGEADLSVEFGGVEITADGSIVVRTGSSSQGQGHATAFAQVAASALDVPLERIRVRQGDTADVPSGAGTFASRSTQVGGAAVQRAAADLLELARASAATILEVGPDDLRYADGAFEIAGSPSHRLTLTEIAATGGGLRAEGAFETPQAFPYGTCVAVVEVDPETGRVHLRTIVSVDDCGTVVNPMLVEGQVHGSLAQGIGQALYEELPYDEYGEPLATSLIDYGVPSAAEVPHLVTASTEVPAPSGLGAKGTGEAGSIGAPPAIVNAVADALRRYDTRGLSMPLTPERVWRLMRPGAGEGSDGERGMSAPPRVLWEPTDETVRTARITSYVDHLRSRGGPAFDGYADLWAWSVEDLAGFWVVDRGVLRRADHVATADGPRRPADAGREVVRRSDAELRRARPAPPRRRGGHPGVRRRRRTARDDAGRARAGGRQRRVRAPRDGRLRGRPRRRVPPERARGDRRAPRHREHRRDLVLVLTRLRAGRGDRPVPRRSSRRS